MKEQDVIYFYNLFEKKGINIWVDGGWGVDALLGSQTRDHKDLDIALEWKHIQKLREILTDEGFKQIREDSQYNCVLSDDKGREIDFHAFIYDEKGNIVDGIKYPVESLTGIGKIDGQTVRCISSEWMVKFHSGYELRESDFHDVSALCKKFDIPLPEEYQRFKK